MKWVITDFVIVISTLFCVKYSYIYTPFWVKMFHSKRCCLAFNSFMSTIVVNNNWIHLFLCSINNVHHSFTFRKYQINDWLSNNCYCCNECCNTFNFKISIFLTVGIRYYLFRPSIYQWSYPSMQSSSWFFRLIIISWTPYDVLIIWSLSTIITQHWCDHIRQVHLANYAAPSKNALSSFQISRRVLSFTLEDSWKN